MKLVASMNTHNELNRYLRDSIPALLEFCDEIRVQDDGSTDGTYEFLAQHRGVVVKQNDGYTWRENEGLLHQQLLDWTVQADPTHVLAIDADEFIPHGKAMREMLEEDDGQFIAYCLRMVEIWHTDPYVFRFDGGWEPHPVAILYKAPGDWSAKEWQIWGRKMAGGRVPRAVRAAQRSERARHLDVDVLHLGWSREQERVQRHQRYMELDGGKFHATDHLASIMLPDEDVGLQPYDSNRLNGMAVR